MSFTVASMKSLQLASQVTYYSGVWILIRGEPLESYSSDWSVTLSGASKAIAGIGKRTVAVTEKHRDFVMLYIQCKVGSQIKHQSLERTLTKSFRKCKAVIGNFDGVSPFVDLEVVEVVFLVRLNLEQGVPSLRRCLSSSCVKLMQLV